MKKNTLKKLGQATLLAAAFTAAAAPAFAQSVGGRGPDGDKQYSSLTREVTALGDINTEIARTIRTAQINGEKVDQDAIKSLRGALKDGMDETAPKIILASGLSAQDVQMLLDQFKQKAGPLPDYLTKVNGKTKFVRVCQEFLNTPDSAVDKEHAVEVANCVASKQSVEPAPAVQTQPVAEQPAPQPVAPAPVTAPVTTPIAPAPVNAAPVTPVTNEAPAKSGLNMVEIGGAAAGVLVLGTGAVLFMRRKKKPEETPVQQPTAVTLPPDPPTPPKEEAKIDVFAKPIQLNQPEKQVDDTGPSKKPRKFDI